MVCTAGRSRRPGCTSAVLVAERAACSGGCSWARMCICMNDPCRIAHLITRILNRTSLPSPQGGADDVEALASAVVDLIGQTACGQCLVWAKSDALVSLRSSQPRVFVEGHRLPCSPCCDVRCWCAEGGLSTAGCYVIPRRCLPCLAAAPAACLALPLSASPQLPPFPSLSVQGAAGEGSQPGPGSGLHRSE